MAVKLAHSPMILHGIVTGFSEKTDFETKASRGYSATVIGSDGGAAKVNFPVDAALPFAPVLSQVVWLVTPGEYDVDGSKGMSTKFVSEVSTEHLLGLLQLLEENAARHPEVAASK